MISPRVPVLMYNVPGYCPAMTIFFFFQAEDGIRDDLVTGVQTCALPISSPPVPTLATVVLVLDHVTARLVSVFPAASLATAESCCVAPTIMLADAGLTVTEATGTAVTVTVAVPLLPPLVAVMLAVPASTPVTRPLDETMATAPAFEAHITVRPVSALPAASCGVAVSWTV